MTTKGKAKPCDTLLICNRGCRYHKYFGEYGDISLCPFIPVAIVDPTLLRDVQNQTLALEYTSNAHTVKDGN
jgi:hypothetical protein